MKNIDLEAADQVALVALAEPISNDSAFTVDIWGYYGQSAIIDIFEADDHEININELKVISNNFLEFKFAIKKHLIKIKNLVLYYGGFNYLGGAEVLNLSIITNSPRISLNPNIASNVIIKTQLTEDEEVIQKLLKSIEIIPGCGEYALNDYSADRSLFQLSDTLPNIKWIAPVVAWFADSLDINNCKILPAAEDRRGPSWKVAGYDRNSAHLITRDQENQINYGGTPDDQGVIDFLTLAKAKNYNIIFYPLIMVDIAKKPWRGHITGKAEDVEGFYQSYYKPFILHYAKLVKDTVDAFIIGSELIGLTRIRDTQNSFPFVKKLIELVKEVRHIVGPNVKLTYAADWSEYHTADGCLRPLDELWASSNIDFVGIDAYFPLTRTTKSRAMIEEIKAGWSGGEGWDYWVDSQGHKHSFNNEGWNQWKNLQYWWSNEHFEWDEKNQLLTPTPWKGKMKPIWFTEFGFPSIDKATNKPNVFYDPKSSDGGIPTYSTGKIDYAMQRKALRATLEFWQNSEFLENLIYWTWDSRGIGWTKLMQDNGKPYYADSPLWEYGHWIDGKIASPTKVVLSGELNFDSLTIEADSLLIQSQVTKKEEVKRYGSKSVHEIYDENISKFTHLRIGVCNFIVKYFEMMGATLFTSKLYVEAERVHLMPIITNHKREETFTGKEHWLTGSQQSSTTTKEWQKFYPTEIYSDVIEFHVNGPFNAEAIKMRVNYLKLEAEEFGFTGIKLKHSVSKNGKSGGGLFKPSKRHNSNEKHEGVEGTLIVVAGQAYMLASSSIWLAATAIGANELYIEAPKVELEALIGSHYHSMEVSKSGARLALTCKPGELSIGAELYHRQTSNEHYKEYAYPSLLIGNEIITINTDILTQRGSTIAGRYGKIMAKEWIATAPRLLEYASSSQMEISIGAKIGIKENVSGFVNNAIAAGSSLQQIADGENRFAPINALFSGYGAICSAAQLASGNVLSAGAFFTANASFANSSASSHTHVMNYARFGTLEAIIDGNISGDLAIEASMSAMSANSINLSSPQDESNFESDYTSIGVEYGSPLSGEESFGLSLSHHEQWNDESMGFGISYDTAHGIGPISLAYGEGEDQLNISFKPTSLAEIQAAFSGDIAGRIKDNITDTLTGIRDLFSPPSTIEQVPYTAEDDYNEVLIEETLSLDNDQVTAQEPSKPIESEEAILENENEVETNLPIELQSTGITQELDTAEETITIKQQVKQLLAKGDELIELVEELGSKGIEKAGEILRDLESKYPKEAAALKLTAAIAAYISNSAPQDPISQAVDKAMDKVGELNEKYIVRPALASLDIQEGEKGYRTGKIAVETLELAGIGKGAQAAAEFKNLTKVKIDVVSKPHNKGLKDPNLAHHLDSFEPKPFNPNDIKEPWMSKKSLTVKQKEQLADVKLYGRNPNDVKLTSNGGLKVNTELNGNENTARKIFEQLTGQKAPEIIPKKGYHFNLQNGKVISIRSKGDSGHAKLEINASKTLSKIHEKITLKEKN